MKTYVCRKLYLYYYLTEQMFVPYKIAPDKWDCKRLVWLYEDTPEIREAVEKFYSNKPENL